MRENGIKIFHHLTYGNALWKVSSYGQKQFFVWGPVGGLETIPAEYSTHYAGKSRLIEWVRRAAVKMLPLNSGFKKRCKNADLMLCKTEITRDLIPAKQRNKAVLFTDVAVEKQPAVANADSKDNCAVEFITIGRLDAWRGFDLVIESFARVAKTHKKMHLTIVGKGADKERLKNIVEQLGMQELVTFTGKVSMDEYYNLLAASDVVVNASLKEGAVTVSFDSMAMGKPLICLDTTGYTRYFSNEYAVVIPRTGREEVIDNLAAAMERMTSADERKSNGEKAKNAGAQFTWAARGEEFKELLKSKLYIYNYAKNEKL
jgi:glycosyltransferase involved in cell wall biosynthesis